MRRALFWLPLLGLLAGSAPPTGGEPSEPLKFRTNRLSVRVMDHEGQPSRGQTVGIWKAGEECTKPTQPLRVAPADEAGVSTFAPIPPGRYTVVVYLDGFATTTLGPFEIGGRGDGPHAPDHLVVVLNPVSSH